MSDRRLLAVMFTDKVGYTALIPPVLATVRDQF
jgi:hypothetical protein